MVIALSELNVLATENRTKFHIHGAVMFHSLI